jgi:transglutaminase-like putative cysteine protease
MLTVRGLPADSRIRIATLDTYDGVVYSVGSDTVNSASGSFTRVPFVYDQSGVSGTQTSISVTVQSYRGVWLPTLGDFESVSFTGENSNALRNSFYYNNTTGTAAVTDHLTTGDSYTLGAVEPKQPTEAQLSSLTPGSASVPLASVLPSEVSSVLNTYVARASTPGAKLVAMLNALKENGYVSHGIGAKAAPSRSGHAADRINELLTDQQMIGDGEQYSVTAALMARELGFPSRVVLGFVPETTGPGTAQIRGKDISAWIEVDTAQYGWVTIDPNPPVRPIPAEKPKDPNQVSRPQTIVPPVVTKDSPPDPQTVPESQQNTAPEIDPFLAIFLTVLKVTGWVVLVILLLLSPFIAIVAVKLRRRRKRRSASGAIEQITGGWQEYHDRVLDHGYQPPPAATRAELAETVGGMQPIVLAAVADRAVFSPDSPDDGEAELVWRSVHELTAALDEGKSRWERILARISLRSFGTVGNLLRR